MKLAEELAAMESALSTGSKREAHASCIRILNTLESDREGFAPPGSGGQTEPLATRIADAISTLLVEPGFTPTLRQARSLLVLKRTIANTFECSRYRTTEVLRDRILPAGNTDDMAPEVICRHLIGVSINNLRREDLAMLDRLPPVLRFVIMLAFLSEMLVWNVNAESMREAILRLECFPGTQELTRFEWILLASAWMGCSYADSPDKHAIKKRLNAVVRQKLLRGGKPRGAMAVRRPQAGRPTLLVVAEIYYRNHAMDRCYRPSLRALRRHFRTVLMMGSTPFNPPVEGLFDDVDEARFDTARPGQWVDRARRHRPDMVYFPSVGMRISGIACANLRLAPIQLASIGHPATTQSPCVDYMVMTEEVMGDPGCFSETLLLRDRERHYILDTSTPRVAPEIRDRPATVRFAVPAWLPKLSPSFLEACHEITSRATRPVEFWFFPNMAGAMYQACARRLTDLLPARVFHTTGYHQYITNLNACDIHLSTFPFGSANGIVDSARQGLPIVNLLGREPHSLLDGTLARRLGQPAWLSAASTGQYVDAALRLVADDALRVSISRTILDSDPDSRFLRGLNETCDDFGEIFLAAYRHHEAIQASGRKVWRLSDLRALEEGPSSGTGNLSGRRT